MSFILLDPSYALLSFLLCLNAGECIKPAGDVLASSFEVYDLNIVSMNEMIMFTSEGIQRKNTELQRCRCHSFDSKHQAIKF